MPCYAYQGVTPVVDPSSYVHPLAALIGDVIVGPGVFVAPGASLRGDFGRIVVVGDSSIQDNVTIHASSDRDTVIGRGAVIGHGAIIHGAVVGENALIGMQSVVLDNAEIGAEALIGALSLVKSEVIIPKRGLAIGNPAVLVRILDEHEVTWRNDGDGEYQRLAREALTDLVEVAPRTQVEVNRPRMRSNALGLRLSGPVAEIRQRRAGKSQIEGGISK
jgi:phenylacetic acid degradation protein